MHNPCNISGLQGNFRGSIAGGFWRSDGSPLEMDGLSRTAVSIEDFGGGIRNRCFRMHGAISLDFAQNYTRRSAAKSLH